MKTIKLAYKVILSVALIAFTSCGDMLDLEPLDNFGSGNYWKTEAQVTAYIEGIHQQLRSKQAQQHILEFGELRGGHFKDGVSADGLTISKGEIRLQNLSKDKPGVTKFGDIYGCITNLNLFIARVTDATFLPEAKKNYYLGQVYGLRALYYFDLYRVYGGVPLRLGIEVIDGELDPNKLYLPRAKPSEIMVQIKSDLDKSLEYFGDVNNFNPYGHGAKVYWSKAATECLIGDVYLWNSKVSIGDNIANEADLEKAKKHLTSVKDNYGLSLQSKFTDIYSTNNKGNSEIIFAARFLEGEQESSVPRGFTYSLVSGTTNSSSYREDGSVWNDPFEILTNGQQMYEYDVELFNSFDIEDTRRDATFMASYRKNENGELYLYGTHVRKNLGTLNSQGNRVYDGDIVYYRLAWVYLALAEIANMEGDNAKVEEYINLVRARAYGNEAGNFKFTAGDFTTNELAILREKDKEFIQEGQRWWDLCRMTLTKGGKHLVFCPEGGIDGQRAVLSEKEAYKVLWPLEQGMLDNDPMLEQTPGYE